MSRHIEELYRYNLRPLPHRINRAVELSNATKEAIHLSIPIERVEEEVKGSLYALKTDTTLDIMFNYLKSKASDSVAHHAHKSGSAMKGGAVINLWDTLKDYISETFELFMFTWQTNAFSAYEYAFPNSKEKVALYQTAYIFYLETVLKPFFNNLYVKFHDTLNYTIDISGKHGGKNQNGGGWLDDFQKKIGDTYASMNVKDTLIHIDQLRHNLQASVKKKGIETSNVHRKYIEEITVEPIKEGLNYLEENIVEPIVEPIKEGLNILAENVVDAATFINNQTSNITASVLAINLTETLKTIDSFRHNLSLSTKNLSIEYSNLHRNLTMETANNLGITSLLIYLRETATYLYECFPSMQSGLVIIAGGVLLTKAVIPLGVTMYNSRQIRLDKEETARQIRLEKEETERKEKLKEEKQEQRLQEEREYTRAQAEEDKKYRRTQAAEAEENNKKFKEEVVKLIIETREQLNQKETFTELIEKTEENVAKKIKKGQKRVLTGKEIQQVVAKKRVSEPPAVKTVGKRTPGPKTVGPRTAGPRTAKKKGGRATRKSNNKGKMKTRKHHRKY